MIAEKNTSGLASHHATFHFRPSSRSFCISLHSHLHPALPRSLASSSSCSAVAHITHLALPCLAHPRPSCSMAPRSKVRMRVCAAGAAPLCPPVLPLPPHSGMVERIALDLSRALAVRHGAKGMAAEGGHDARGSAMRA